jgi:histidyl-tRNA synthetase
MAYWQYIEAVARRLSADYQYEEIRTPLFESFDLFVRGVGASSDIVSKEMYDFFDKSERHLALKPESTASVVRAYVENKLYATGDYQKFFYISPHFRYERAQAGRYRQHHQFGAEVFGPENPYVDAEVILFAVTFLRQLGLKDFTVALNSLGNTQTREDYRTALQDYFRPYLPELCTDCQSRFALNPLRMLDCKKDADHVAMAGAPKLQDFLDDDAKTYMATITSLLETFNIPFRVDDKLVRGLDYYTQTVFEIVLDNPNAAKSGSLTGGGRYNGLVAEIGGPETSGIGFGIGIERLMLALQEQGVDLPTRGGQRIFVANLEMASSTYAMEIVQALRAEGLNVATNYAPKAMKAIFKQSDRFAATLLITIGASELANGTMNVRDVATKEQRVTTLTAFLQDSK